MRKIGIVVVCLFLFCGLASVAAQSTLKIEGYVFSANGKPLQGANVVVVGTGFGAATNSKGYYVIENLFASEYTLAASFMGYQEEVRKGVVVHKDFAATVNFKLQPKILSLNEIVVEAQAEHQRAGDFREKITAEQIRKSGARTVAELLINLPGVDIIEGGGGRKRISIRGSNTNQVLILLDGVPLNDPLTGDVDLNQISLANIEEITVLKGGHSSLYGSGALGGVVKIMSQDNAVDEIRLNGGFGRYGALSIQPSVSGNLGKLHYFFNFETLREDGDYPYTYQRPDGTPVKESRLNADFSSQNYFGKLVLHLAHHSFQIQTHLSRSTRGLPGLVFAWTPYADAKTDRRILLGKYTFQKNNWHSQIQISQHLNQTEFQNAPPAEAPLRFRTVPPYHTRYRILSHRGSFEGTYRFANKHSLFLRTVLQNDDFRDGDLLSGTPGSIRETDNLNYSLTLRNEWQLPKPEFLSSFTLDHALRFDLISFKNAEVEREEYQFSPRLGLFVSRNNGWLVNVRANWGRSFRVPTFADLFFQDFRVRGNANLQPEKSWDLDAGVQFGLPLFGWVEFSGTYFRHKIKNLIVWELGSFASWQPSNTDAFLQGWQLGGSWEAWKGHMHLNVSHRILNALDKSGHRTTHDKRLTYRPEHTTKFGLEIILPWRDITFNYHRRRVGKRFVTPSNTVSMPSYAVDDVTVLMRHKFNKFKVELKFSVFNLFDEKYEIVERAPLPGRYWRTELEVTY